ncbi:hypothetical protein MVEN_00248200 [Mycena venus]|uniref:Ricin B lectin domain-containing protein n=1 Tax=Mycena venus TaxID=2733690 RepID=A0A8H7DF55_9AGAR|nr:hypothetical protein MVEN_00248200 [Mycena venus]
MFSSASLLTACILAISGLVSAAPPLPVQCNPNFEGAGVSIIDTGIEWGVSPAVAGTLLDRTLGGFPLNATAEWHVEQTGAFPPTYYVKEINHNNLVVDISADGLLVLEELNPTKETQIWSIFCNQCSPGASSTPGGGEFASSCQIVSASNGFCARVEPAGVNLGTGECENGILQSFDFWTATA